MLCVLNVEQVDDDVDVVDSVEHVDEVDDDVVVVVH